jgi:hypothetical protein
MIHLYLPPVPSRSESPRWLLLIHQLPKEPAYLRVKIGRRLARVGAVALKNSVYVLPRREGTVEDFEWVRREIVEGGGEATVVEAHLVSGQSDGEIEAKFREAKDGEYAAMLSEAEALEVTPFGRRKRPLSDEERAAALASLAQLERRMNEASATDFFDAPGRAVLASCLDARRLKLEPRAESGASAMPTSVVGRTWVTRAGMHVDRIASAWLIRRSIDPRATFKFVPAKTYAHTEGELRFDMFEAEYSHVGDACTFETLLARFSLDEAGLRAVAEVVHDIDLKDGKFGRPETPGVAACIAGICRSSEDDEARLARGSVIFDGLLAQFASTNRTSR